MKECVGFCVYEAYQSPRCEACVSFTSLNLSGLMYIDAGSGWYPVLTVCFEWKGAFGSRGAIGPF